MWMFVDRYDLAHLLADAARDGVGKEFVRELWRPYCAKGPISRLYQAEPTPEIPERGDVHLGYPDLGHRSERRH